MNQSNVQTYDAIIVGSGQGGQPLSTAFARAGWKTALIERKLFGGTCVNVGCTPTKTMVASARIAHLARRAGEYGVHFDGKVRVNLAEVRKRKQQVVESFRNGGQQGAENTPNLDLIFGEASFDGPQRMLVKKLDGTTIRIRSERIILNVGARTLWPKVEGIDSVGALTSTTIMELDEIPEHLLVQGGGYIGVEFGQMFHRFGSRVTLLQRGPQLLPREDPDVAEAVQKILVEEGLDVHVKTEVLAARRDGNRVVVRVQGPDGEREVSGSHLLLGVGRAPNTEALNLPVVGVVTERHGNIVVNDQLETNVPGIWAMGDCKGGPQFTHISWDDHRILKTNLLEGGKASIEGRLVPYTVFMDPQLAGVGLTETEAKKKGVKFQVGKLPMEHIARAIEMGETRGFMKVLVDAATGEILGATVLGMEGGELMAMLEIAMLGKLHYTALSEGIFAHPTLAEALNNLFGDLK